MKRLDPPVLGNALEDLRLNEAGIYPEVKTDYVYNVHVQQMQNIFYSNANRVL